MAYILIIPHRSGRAWRPWRPWQCPWPWRPTAPHPAAAAPRRTTPPCRTIPPCIAPPHPGTRDCSTFAKLGFLSEPAHATPNPQENSCRQPKTMLIKYEAKFPCPSNPSGYWIADSSLANFLGFCPKTSPSPRAHTRKSSLSNLQLHPRPSPAPPGSTGKRHHPGLHRF